jgi:hypothetical protein
MLLYRVCFLVYALRSRSVFCIRQNTRDFGELQITNSRAQKQDGGCKIQQQKEEMVQNVSSSEPQVF